MSQVKIRQALETQLNSISPAIATAWENMDYTPVSGTPYQEVSLIFAEPDNPAAGSAFYQERGYLQVRLMYPTKTGASAATARAALVRAAFPRKTSLVKEGVTVTIDRTPQVSPAPIDGDRYPVLVRIRFYANIN